MTPLEINKKIAEKKELPFFQTATGRNGVCIEHSSFKNWAENISDAFKLFEEMSIDLFLNYFKDSDGILKWRLCNIGYDGIYNNFSVAETAPLAICKAWLAWKDNI